MGTFRALGLLAGLLATATGCRAAPGVARHAVLPDSAAGRAADSLPTTRIDALLAQLRSPSPTLRAQAAVALAAAGPRSDERIHALAATLGDTNAHAANNAAWALARFERDAIPALLDAMTDRRPTVRARAIYALGEMGQAAAGALPRVRAALRDESRAVRDMAGWSVTRIDVVRRGTSTASLGTISDLRAGLASPDPLVRTSAVLRHRAFAAGDLGASIPLLINSLSDPDPGVRAAAADALVLVGPPARPALVGALSDTNAVRRREASIILVRLSRPAL